MTTSSTAAPDPHVAREVLSDGLGMIIAWLNAAERQERARAEPDPAMIAFLEFEDGRWSRLRHDIWTLDDQQVEAAIEEYAPLVRALNGA